MRRGRGRAVGGGAVVGEGEDDNKWSSTFRFGASRCRGDCNRMGRGWMVFGRRSSRGGMAAPMGHRGGEGSGRGGGG